MKAVCFPHHAVRKRRSLCSANPTTHFRTPKHMASVLESLLGSPMSDGSMMMGLVLGFFNIWGITFHLFLRLLRLFTCLQPLMMFNYHNQVMSTSL